MRPRRIEVEGFSAYRGQVTVDFEGVDFFSLAGPTGSGKSSLIDAMVFALYGRVPRLGGNAVAPAITAGADRARVRFDFDVGGVGYTAVRMAQRTSSGGASVKEARLQKGDQVLADKADDVTTAVEELLRLRFDDFTRTVVLPQGEFARFLTATKAERQGLLRSLLGLDVYTRVRELARTRQAVANERAESTARAIESLEIPDDETPGVVRRQCDLLEELAGSIGGREKELVELERAIETLHTEGGKLADAIDRLQSIEVPEELDAHEQNVAAARSDLVDSETALVETREALEGLGVKLEALAGPEQIKSWTRLRGQLAYVEQRLAETGLEEAGSAVEGAVASLETVEEALLAARKATASARMEHSAHELAGQIEIGEPCPVCAQTVTEEPNLTAVPAIADLEEAEDRASAEVDAARRAAGDARANLASTETAVTELEGQKASLEEELEGAPGADELVEIADRLGNIQLEVEKARKELGLREDAHKVASNRLADLSDASRQISKQLMAAQVKVAILDPPVPESDDPAVQWKELSAWRDEMLEKQLKSRDALADRTEKAEAGRVAKRQELIATLRDAGLDAQEPFAVEVATALQAVRTKLEAFEKAKTESAELTKLLTASTEETAVAAALVDHLRANGFERWMMVGALTDLVAGANQLLGELSGGGYSLHTDDSGDFSIIDHRNADERRSVATLSGGETFLVSLALALSLAETLAAKGGSGLEAIILDEGFGTLDDESLDTVASVLEELTSKGLMVGVITHVKELAVRAPVRYEVTREPEGATVRLVS